MEGGQAALGPSSLWRELPHRPPSPPVLPVAQVDSVADPAQPPMVGLPWRLALLTCPPIAPIRARQPVPVDAWPCTALPPALGSTPTPACSPADPTQNLPGKPNTRLPRVRAQSNVQSVSLSHWPEAVRKGQACGPGRRGQGVEVGTSVAGPKACPQPHHAGGPTGRWGLLCNGRRRGCPAIPDVGHEMITDDSLGAAGCTALVWLMVFRRKILITCEIEDLFSDSAPRSDSAEQAEKCYLSSIPGRVGEPALVTQTPARCVGRQTSHPALRVGSPGFPQSMSTVELPRKQSSWCPAWLITGVCCPHSRAGVSGCIRPHTHHRDHPPRGHLPHVPRVQGGLVRGEQHRHPHGLPTRDPAGLGLCSFLGGLRMTSGAGAGDTG